MPRLVNSIHSPSAEAPAATELAFATLVNTMRDLCEVERDIAGMDHGDPAFDSWFFDAETARATSILAAESVIMSTALTATDRRFRTVARNYEAMLLAHDAQTYAFLSEALMSTAWLYNVSGRGPRAARATALLKQFRHFLGLLQSLPDYMPEPGTSTASATMAA